MFGNKNDSRPVCQVIVNDHVVETFPRYLPAAAFAKRLQDEYEQEGQTVKWERRDNDVRLTVWDECGDVEELGERD